MKQTHCFLSNCWTHYLYQSQDRTIHYISQIQGDKPGWYVWLGNGAVYELMLQDSTLNAESDSASKIETTRVAIKYYPKPGEACFEYFSIAEQVIRFSPLFDDSVIVEKHECHSGCACSALISRRPHDCHQTLTKGIPRVLSRSQIPEDFYSVGELMISMKEDQLQQIMLRSQDLLLSCSVSGIEIADEQGQVHPVLAAGETDRSVMGWQLSFDFAAVLFNEVFTRMGICLDSQPRQIEPGNVCFFTKEGATWVEPSLEANLISQVFIRKEDYNGSGS